jgi:hypothetical protein
MMKPRDKANGIRPDFSKEITASEDENPAEYWRQWWAKAKQQAEEDRANGNLEAAEEFFAMLAEFESLEAASDEDMQNFEEQLED